MQKSGNFQFESVERQFQSVPNKRGNHNNNDNKSNLSAIQKDKSIHSTALQDKRANKTGSSGRSSIGEEHKKKNRERGRKKGRKKRNKKNTLRVNKRERNSLRARPIRRTDQLRKS